MRKNLRRAVILLVCLSVLGAVVALGGCVGTPTAGSSSSEATQTKEAAAPKPLNLAIGTAADYPEAGKVTVLAAGPGPKDYSGKPTFKVTVKYENTGKEALSFNEFDWKIEDPNGARSNNTAILDSSPKTLGSGEVAPGGNVQGDMYFSDAGGVVKVVYEPSLFAGEENLATWAVK